jgi:hypothetical protein
MAKFEELALPSQKEQLKRWDRRDAKLNDPKRTREQADKEYERDNKRAVKKASDPRGQARLQKYGKYIKGVGWTEKGKDE